MLTESLLFNCCFEKTLAHASRRGVRHLPGILGHDMCCRVRLLIHDDSGVRSTRNVCMDCVNQRRDERNEPKVNRRQWRRLVVEERSRD